jgi:hypothetical protein
MIQGEEDETRAAWGIRGRPWLILTDKDHVVRAEGFGLDELQNKLDNAVGETITSPAR